MYCSTIPISHTRIRSNFHDRTVDRTSLFISLVSLKIINLRSQCSFALLKYGQMFLFWLYTWNHLYHAMTFMILI